MAGGLLAAAVACAAGVATAAGTTTVPGNVAGWVKSAQKTGSASSSTQVTIAVHMALKNTAGLKKLVDQVSSPKSSRYGRYLSNEEFAAGYAPAASDVDAVKALLERAGMAEVAVGPHGVYVSAKATVAQLTKAFGVDQNLYSYKGMTLRANTKAPTIPAALGGKVLFIEGLDDTGMMRTPLHRLPNQDAAKSSAVRTAAVENASSEASAPANTPPPPAAALPSPYCNHFFGGGASVATLSTPADVYGASIPWLGCGYDPSEIRAAYGVNRVKYDGSGVKVAIVDAYASPTLLADANRYSNNHGLPALAQGHNFTQIIPPGIYTVNPNDPCGPVGWWTEQSLDVDAVHGMAPGAHILYVGSADCNASLDIAFLNVIYQHLADVITNSYGYGGEAIPPGQQAADDQGGMAAAAMGITVFFSSGDDGDVAFLNGVASGAWPATGTYFTGVGGTTLFLDDKSGAKQEYGWGTYRDFLTDATVNSAKSVTDSGVAQTTAFGLTFDAFSFYAGSGGGISLLESQPAYQAGVVPPNLAVSLNLASGYTETLPNPMRVSPDISMDADPYTGYLYGQSYTIAGNPINDAGCVPTSKKVEYCEQPIGGTSLSSPLMAGFTAVLNQARKAKGEPMIGFANPWLYSVGSGGDGVNLSEAAINQIIAPTEPVSMLRGYASNLHEVRVITVTSVPFLITTAPYALQVCGAPICTGIDDIFNFTSLSPYANTPAGYNDVTGLGVPWAPKLLQAE
jgi:subtilase family serine protease